MKPLFPAEIDHIYSCRLGPLAELYHDNGPCSVIVSRKFDPVWIKTVCQTGMSLLVVEAGKDDALKEKKKSE